VFTVGGLTFGEDKTQRIAVAITNGVYLGRKAAATPA